MPITKTDVSDIPFVKQSQMPGDRRCGAACLSMVYRAFGKEISPAEIWPRIAKRNREGVVSSTTHLMVSNALAQGFAALAIQTRYPLQTMRVCRDLGIYAILNHRLQLNDSAGHYTVLVDFDDEQVVLHDPFFGPYRRIAHAELLQLWQPLTYQGGEISGNVLIAIAKKTSVLAKCDLCRAALPAETVCPKCKETLGLEPAEILGCIDHQCMGRMWNRLCCPKCDHLWGFDMSEEERAQGPGLHIVPPKCSDGQSSVKLDRMFGELDKFCAHLLNLPGVSDDPRVRRQLDFIQASKAKLTLAQAEQAAFHKMRQKQVAALVENAKQRKEAHQKQMDDLTKPRPPIDGSALGSTLLRELGFVS